MTVFVALALTFAQPAAPPATRPVDVTTLTFSAPVSVVEFDTGKLKGDLARLAWSPDATQVYLQTTERDLRAGSVKVRHYVVGLDGQSPKDVNQEPPWAVTYWAWKSGQAAPGLPSMKISVEQQQKRVTPTATPMGGDLARGGPTGATPGTGSGYGVSVGEAARAAEQSSMVSVFTLRLKGEVVGEFVNTPAMPGFTFGWAPAGTGLIAFANTDARLVVMDLQGRKREVPSTKAVLLPAWTDDGKRLGYLERAGRKKLALRVVDVAIP